MTTTAVTRRQDLYLKRLRSGESSDVSILAGIVAPPVLLCLDETLVVFAATFVIGVKFPGQWWWGVVAFLASDDARFVNGVNLPVDGGLSASNGQPPMG